jgi:hypothetical protein
MLKAFQKFSLLFSVIIITAHSILPHIHHLGNGEFIQHALSHHDDDYDHDHENHSSENNWGKHNAFSFIQIDDNFVPSSVYCWNVDINYALIPETIKNVEITNLFVSEIKYRWYYEFPPPKGCFRTPSFRGPPLA